MKAFHRHSTYRYVLHYDQQKIKSTTKKPAWASRPGSAVSTARSEQPEPHNIFRPVSALSTDDEWDQGTRRRDNVGDTLTQSINKLHSLQNRLSEMRGPGEGGGLADKTSVPNSGRSVATQQSDETLRASMRSQSIDDFIQDIMERTPGNSESRDLAAGDGLLLPSSTPESVTGVGPKSSALANNMFRPGHKPKTKASLSSMENSYQNIKHKTPVNQVKKPTSCNSKPKGNNRTGTPSRRPLHQGKGTPSTKDSLSQSTVEEYMDVLTSAAVKIQKWYRRHRTRRIAAEAAVKRLLGQKKEVSLSSFIFSNGVKAI